MNFMLFVQAIGNNGRFQHVINLYSAGINVFKIRTLNVHDLYRVIYNDLILI